MAKMLLLVLLAVTGCAAPQIRPATPRDQVSKFLEFGCVTSSAATWEPVPVAGTAATAVSVGFCLGWLAWDTARELHARCSR